MKNGRSIGIGLIILFIGVYALIRLNRNTLLLWNSNSISVTADKPLKTDKVMIEFGISAFAGKTSDKDLLKNRTGYTVVYNGKTENELSNGYGENDFLVTYDNTYYYTFRHFKLNHKHQQDYHFHFYQQQGDIMMQVEIIGEDEMRFESKMKKIDQISLSELCGGSFARSDRF